MEELFITRLNNLIEQASGLLDRVVRTRVFIASNTFETYSLMEQIRVALIQSKYDDPNFINILANTHLNENEPTDSSLEFSLQELNELISKFD